MSADFRDYDPMFFGEDAQVAFYGYSPSEVFHQAEAERLDEAERLAEEERNRSIFRMLLGRDSSENTYYGNGLCMNQKEARQCILDSLGSDSLIAVIGMNSDKVADSVCKAIHQNMPKTTVEMGDNHGESPDTFLNALLNHLLEEKSKSIDILERNFNHPYVQTAKKIIDINRTLVTDKYDRNPLDQLDISRRRMGIQDNFNGIIENLGTVYPGKDFLILMKVSCDTNLTCQAMKRLKMVSENQHIKIMLFIEMTHDYYNQIRDYGFFDSEIYVQED